VPLSKEEQATLDALMKKAEEQEPAANGHSRVENVNITINLDDEKQVRRAVKSGLLPASYLDEEEDGDEEDGEGQEEEEQPRRRARFE
jgi:hypothetical protein